MIDLFRYGYGVFVLCTIGSKGSIGQVLVHELEH